MPLRKGTVVAAAVEAFDGAEPFDAYVITAVHKDGTVDLAAKYRPDHTVARRVRTRHLTVIH